MNPATIAAFFLGVQRLAAMGAAVWCYDQHNMMLALIFAGYATGTQLWDNLKVQKQVTDAQTTTSVTVQQPADTQTPVAIAPLKVDVAPSPQPPAQGV